MTLDFRWQDGDRVLFLYDAHADDPLGYAHVIPTMVTARYPERFIDYFPRPVGGNRVGDVLGHVDHDILGNDPPPTWIVIDLGMNDVMHNGTGTPLGRFQDAYRTLLMRLAQTKANLICLTTTVIGEELDDAKNRAAVGYNEAILNLGFAQGADVIDINAAFRDTLRRAQARNPDIRFTKDDLRLNVYGLYLETMLILKGVAFAL